MTDSWERPYSPGSGRWLVIAWEVAAFGLLGWTSIRQFDLSGSGVWWLAGLLGLVWAIGAVRVMRMGVCVSARGVRLRGLWRTRTLRWAEIEHVRLHKKTHRLGAWEIESGMTVLIECRDGGVVDTELWAQGVDFHSRPHVFRDVYHELRSRHLDAVRAVA